MCDVFVLATGTSARQMRSVADDVLEYASSQKLETIGQGSHAGESWIAIDLIDIVVHLFSVDARMHYDLDNLWGDAPDVVWNE